MKRFTSTEKSNGELAVRQMSEKAQRAYSGTDLLSVYEYIDYDATAEAEEKAFDNDIDFYPGELNVIRYAINDSGEMRNGLTFDEAEKYLESLAEDIEEDDE